jgi:SAM-dependent methyltransferase
MKPGSAVEQIGNTQRKRPAPAGKEKIALWEIYRFSYHLAWRSASLAFAKDVARLLLEPCNYWRNVEVPAVLNHLQVRPGERVLDIGSPKLPSLFLWHRRGAEVYATDLYPYFLREYAHYAERLGKSPAGADYRMEVQDARGLTFPDEYFDKVYAISVVEHIEEDGDSRAMQEIRRVLKPGGLCCLTVPYALRYRESLIDHDLYYKKTVDGQPVFYQRHYDQQTLQTRLILPSGLSVDALAFFGERWFAYERFYDALPRLAKIPFSLLGPIFSALFLRRVSPTAANAKAALILLRKDGGPAAHRAEKD